MIYFLVREMSKNRSKFLTKAKRKIFKLKCTKGNVSTIVDESIFYENKIELKKAVLTKSPVIFLDKNYSLYSNKKKTQSIVELKEYDTNISKLPILVFTPEKKRNKLTSTFAERSPIESLMTEDRTITSLSISSINLANSQITCSLITNDTTAAEMEFAYTNILYYSPKFNKRSNQSFISEDLTNFSSINLKNKSVSDSSKQFRTISSENFQSLIDNSSEIFF